MRNCEKCIWYGDCYQENGCDNYTYLYLEYIKNTYSKDDKYEYYEAWLQYIKDWN